MNLDRSAATHAHAVTLDACLDLVNTLELTDGVPEDRMATAQDAITLLTDLELGHGDDLRRQSDREGAAWLDRVRDVRAALREVWDAQVERRPPAGSALATLNSLLGRGPRAELLATASGTRVAHRHSQDDPTGEALARAAAPLVDAIASGDTGRFRVCANDGCRWVFADASRAGRRRWCDMATCGNRAKVARYRSRRRAGEGPGGAAAAG